MITRILTGDKIRDKAGNVYRATEWRTKKNGGKEWLLTRQDGKARWIAEELVLAFSEKV